jgi:hypothetical protein
LKQLTKGGEMKKYEELELYNPITVVSAIQKTKFKFAGIPILLVLISFIGSYKDAAEWTNYLALAGLILYLLVVMLFRVNRRLRYLDEQPSLVFPINGKIIELEPGRLSIAKKIFEPAEIRWAGQDFNLQSLAGKIYIFDAECSTAGRLIGVAPFSAICQLAVPPTLAEKYKVGMKVQAGQAV